MTRPSLLRKCLSQFSAGATRQRSSAAPLSTRSDDHARHHLHQPTDLPHIVPHRLRPAQSLVATSTTRQCHHHRYYSTTSTLRQALVHKDSVAAQPTEEELNETEDTVPVWANPLHVNDPELKKMFPEDFEDGEEMPIMPLPPLEVSEDQVVAPPHLHQLAHEIVHGLNLLELRELTDKIADHFGFDDEMMAASYGGGGGAMEAGGATAGEAAPVIEVKTIFDLKLVGFDAKAKIKVIKEVRAIAGLGLKEAKELVESAPKVIQKDLKQDKADELKAQLEAVGAEIEIV